MSEQDGYPWTNNGDCPKECRHTPTPKKKHTKRKPVWTPARWPYLAPKPAPDYTERPVDSPELVAAIRKEIARRERKLVKARAKFPPSLIEKGRGKRKRYVPNPDFTPKMRAKMHKYGFTSEQVRNDLIAQGMS